MSYADAHEFTIAWIPACGGAQHSMFEPRAGRSAKTRRSGSGNGDSLVREPQIPARARRRCGGRAALRRRICRAAAASEKTLIWHLYQAAIAGRDIYYDQKHRDALEMRGILEQIVAHPQGVDAATLAEIQRYTKLFWINNGPYNNLTARKFVLKTARREAFAAAAQGGRADGAASRRAGESLDAMLARLQPMFFDAERRSDRHQQDAGRRARTSCTPAPTTCTRASRWPTSRDSPRSTASTRAS